MGPLFPHRQRHTAAPESSTRHGCATGAAGALLPMPSTRSAVPSSDDERPALSAIPWTENSSWAQWSMTDEKPLESQRDDGSVHEGFVCDPFDPKNIPARWVPREGASQVALSSKSPRQRRSDASTSKNASFGHQPASKSRGARQQLTGSESATPAGASLRRVDKDLSGRRRRTDRRDREDSHGGSDAPLSAGAPLKSGGATLTSILKRASRSPTLQQTLSTASSNSINNFLRGLMDDATGSDDIDSNDEHDDQRQLCERRLAASDLLEDGETECTMVSGNHTSLMPSFKYAAASPAARGGSNMHVVKNRSSLDGPTGIPVPSCTAHHEIETNSAGGRLGIGSPHFSTRIPRSLDEVIGKMDRRTQKGGGGRLGIESRVDVFQPAGYFHGQDFSDRLSTFGGTDVAIGCLTPRRHDFPYSDNASPIGSYEGSKEHEILGRLNSIQAGSEDLLKLMNRLDTGESEFPQYQELKENQTIPLGSSLPNNLQRSPGSLNLNGKVALRTSGKTFEPEKFTSPIASEPSLSMFATRASYLRNLEPLISDVDPSREIELDLTPPSPPPEFRREQLIVNSEPLLRYPRRSPDATCLVEGANDENFRLKFDSILKEYQNKEKLSNEGLKSKHIKQELALQPVQKVGTEELIQKHGYPTVGFRWEHQESNQKVDTDDRANHSVRERIESIEQRQEREFFDADKGVAREKPGVGSSLEIVTEFPLLQQRLAQSKLEKGKLCLSTLIIDDELPTEIDGCNMYPVPAQTHDLDSSYNQCKSQTEALQTQTPSQSLRRHTMYDFISPSHQEKLERRFPTPLQLGLRSPLIQNFRQIQSEPPNRQSRASPLQVHYNLNESETGETEFGTSVDQIHHELLLHENTKESVNRLHSFNLNHSLSKQQIEKYDCGSDFSRQRHNVDMIVSAAGADNNDSEAKEYARVLLPEIVENRGSVTQFDGLNFSRDHGHSTHDEERHLVVISSQSHRQLPKHLRSCTRDPPHGEQHLIQYERAKKEPEGRSEQEKTITTSVRYDLDEDAQSTIVSVTDIFDNLDDVPRHQTSLLSGSGQAVSIHAVSTPVPVNADGDASPHPGTQSAPAGDNGDVDSQTAVLGELRPTDEFPENAFSQVSWGGSWASITKLKRAFSGTVAGKQVPTRIIGSASPDEHDVAPVETMNGVPKEEKKGPTANIRNYWSAVVGVKTMGSFDSTTQNSGDAAISRGATASPMHPESGRKSHRLRVANTTPTPTSTGSYMLPPPPPPPPPPLPPNYTSQKNRRSVTQQTLVKKATMLPPKTVQIPQVSEEKLYDMRPLFSADSDDMYTMETGQDTEHKSDSGAGCSFFVCGDLSEWLPKCF